MSFPVGYIAKLHKMRISKEKIAKLYEMFEEKHPLKRIAEELGISLSSATNYTRFQRVAARKRRKEEKMDHGRNFEHWQYSTAKPAGAYSMTAYQLLREDGSVYHTGHTHRPQRFEEKSWLIYLQENKLKLQILESRRLTAQQHLDWMDILVKAETT